MLKIIKTLIKLVVFTYLSLVFAVQPALAQYIENNDEISQDAIQNPEKLLDEASLNEPDASLDYEEIKDKNLNDAKPISIGKQIRRLKKELLKNKDPEIQYQLGLLHLKVGMNYSALTYFTKAAEQGHKSSIKLLKRTRAVRDNLMMLAIILMQPDTKK